MQNLAAPVYWPPSRITFETAAAAAISRPGMMDVSWLPVPWLSHLTGLANGLFWNFSNSMVSLSGCKEKGKQSSQGARSKIKQTVSSLSLSWRHANRKKLRYSIEGEVKMRHDMWLAREATFRGHDEKKKAKSRLERKENASFSRFKRIFFSSRESRCRVGDYLIWRRKTFSITLSIFTEFFTCNQTNSRLLKSLVDVKLALKIAQGFWSLIRSSNYVTEVFIIFLWLHNALIWNLHRNFFCFRLQRNFCDISSTLHTFPLPFYGSNWIN